MNQSRGKRGNGTGASGRGWVCIQAAFQSKRTGLGFEQRSDTTRPGFADSLLVGGTRAGNRRMLGRLQVHGPFVPWHRDTEMWRRLRVSADSPGGCLGEDSGHCQSGRKCGR